MLSLPIVCIIEQALSSLRRGQKGLLRRYCLCEPWSIWDRDMKSFTTLSPSWWLSVCMLFAARERAVCQQQQAPMGTRAPRHTCVRSFSYPPSLSLSLTRPDHPDLLDMSPHSMCPEHPVSAGNREDSIGPILSVWSVEIDVELQPIQPSLTHTLLSEEVVARNAPGVTKALAIPREATAAAAVTFMVIVSVLKGEMREIELAAVLQTNNRSFMR